MSKYGLALIAEYMPVSNGVSFGCEYLSEGEKAKDTKNKTVISSFWFDSEADRLTCVCYADALANAMIQLHEHVGGKMQRFGYPD